MLLSTFQFEVVFLPFPHGDLIFLFLCIVMELGPEYTVYVVFVGVTLGWLLQKPEVGLGFLGVKVG